MVLVVSGGKQGSVFVFIGVKLVSVSPEAVSVFKPLWVAYR